MKYKLRLAKLFLAIVLAFTTLSFTNQQDYTISAKISGDYSYEVDSNGALTILNYNGDEKSLTIPSEIDGIIVKRIGYGAFSECKSIEELTIPDSVTVIENYAFSQCSQMKEVKIPDSIVSIGQYAFAGCSSLETVTIPRQVNTLNYGTFFDCVNLKNVIIPEGIKNIGGLVFGNCKSLESIVLPKTLTSIGNNGFANCTALKSITINKGVTTLASGAFSGCLSLSEIELPDTLVAIGQNAFQDCISLESIKLPDSITGLGYGAFTGCSSLVDINIPSKLTEIKNATFSGCSSLTTLVIPTGIKSLGDNVFSGCVSLSYIDIPDSVISIGASTFSNCSKLTSVKLSKNIKTIPTNLFRYCDSLETIVLPNGLREISATSFSDCSKLKSVLLPETINKIEGKIFVNSPSVVAYVIENSEAHLYMQRNNYDFELIQKGLNLDKTVLTLNKGDTSKFVAILSPFNVIDNSELTWTSDNPNCVSVDENGVVTAIKEGTATITAKTSNGWISKSIVNVTDKKIGIESVSLNETALTLSTQTKQGLRAKINPTDTTDDKTLTWESTNVEVATVSATGMITARNPGTAKISVTSSNGKYAECVVTVISNINFVSLNLTAMEMEEGAKQTLRATINPSNTTNSKELKWKSSNTNVATVDENGAVTAVSKGYATITVETVNGKKAECKITVAQKNVEIPIESVSLDKKELYLEVEGSYTLLATINPANTTDSKEMIWKSSDEKIASVDNKGKVTAWGVGTANITVTTSNGKSANCTVTVKEKAIPIESVSLDKKELNLEVEGSSTLLATINPANTTDSKELKWQSSDEKVAVVDSEGKVTAVGAGTANITVTTSNGKSANCTVTVKEKAIPIESVSLDKKELNLKIKESYTLLATINPANTTDSKELIWKSSDEKVASVDNKGKVTALGAGTANIIVVTSNGKTASCVVNVIQMNTDELRSIIASAEAFKEQTYTIQSYQELMVQLTKAKNMLNDSSAEQVEIDSMVKDLQGAVDALVIRAENALLSSLQAVIDACKQLESEYTPEEFVNMKKAIEDAETLMNSGYGNISKKDAEATIELLNELSLELSVNAAKDILQNNITIASDILNGDVSDYDGESIQKLRKALSAAQELIDANCMDLAQIYEKNNTLETAIKDLNKPGNISDLQDLVEFVTTISAEKYTKASWDHVSENLVKAQTIIKNNNVGQNVIDQTYSDLLSAINSLEIKVDKSALQMNMKMAQNIVNHIDSYEIKTVYGLKDLLNEAKTLDKNENATQDEVAAMSKKLLKAIMKARVKE